MRWRMGEVGRMFLGYGYLGDVGRLHSSRRVFLLLVAMGLVFVVGLLTMAGVAAAACPNQALRVGPSAGLPDCRAYELVTPVNLGRSQALTFTIGIADHVISSGDGEALALEAPVPFGPNPSVGGVRAVFSRAADGWEMRSAIPPGAGATRLSLNNGLFIPNLSQVALQSETALNFGEPSPDVSFEAGPLGGPYAVVASVPQADALGLGTTFLGASADFSNVLLASVDHELPVLGAEGAAAKATDSGAFNLYDWSGGNLQLVNAKQDGSPLANLCGARLGAELGEGHGGHTVHAISEDGSTIFFTVPATQHGGVSGPGCEAPTSLFMRVNSGEPVEVSAPVPGVKLEPSEILPVRYNYATPEGSKVFFNTQTPLTAGETPEEKGENKLFEYDTRAPEGKRLRLISNNVPMRGGVGLEDREGFFFGEDGEVVYIESYPSGEFEEVARLETSTGKRTFVALAHPQKGTDEPSYVTPSGEFFLFKSESLVDPAEPRGSGQQNGGKGPDELYRYAHGDGSVMCVTCGAGDAPPKGGTIGSGTAGHSLLETQDETPGMTQITEDGQKVFFDSTAQLVPQDTNSTEEIESEANGAPGLDVYEWEAEGSEETPGVLCRDVNGCTHLLSSGEDVGPARLLGVSQNGRDVFLESASQLVPQATEEFPNIYDARVDGGFQSSQPPIECLSCQGVGSPPPLFSVPASESFAGSGNATTHVVEEKQKKGKRKKNKKSQNKGKRPRATGGRAVRPGRKPADVGYRGRLVRANGRGA